MAAALLLCACSQSEKVDEQTKAVTFSLHGDFEIYQEPMTRTLEADGKAMTDIWALDYVDGSLKQQMHQVSTDADFGNPRLPLSFGAHHIYFVASRGRDASLNTADGTMTFSSVSDTFWRDYTVTINSSSASVVTIDLDRIVSKVRVSVSDAIPEGAATINITPATWYYGFNYTNGLPCAARTGQLVSVALPASVIGTTGLISSIFGFSDAVQWNTDVAVDSRTSSGTVIGSASVDDVPVERNKVTTISGTLYAPVNTHGITLNTDWAEPIDLPW